MLTPFEIQEAIEAEMERQQTLLEELRQVAIDHARAEADFKIGFAKERLKVRAEGGANGAKITVDTADDHATVATESEYYNRLLTTNNMMTLREAIHASKTRIEGLRTLAASQRTITP
jgi:chemotaxis regulatin CheY-phosphate phosphatase CheZ